MTCKRESELLEQIEQTGQMYKVSALQLIKAGKRIAELESLNGALFRDNAGMTAEREGLAAQNQALREVVSELVELETDIRDGMHDSFTFQPARESIALPDLSADILRARDARNGAYEMRRGARVIELFDDATMKGDHMLDSSECASILNALADELEQAK